MTGPHILRECFCENFVGKFSTVKMVFFFILRYDEVRNGMSSRNKESVISQLKFLPEKYKALSSAARRNCR